MDHYVIREVLGAGGFGITYLAEHEALGKLYAIKEYFPHAFSYRQGATVRPTSASDGTYNWGLERFETEARSLAKFKHPAIVDVTSTFKANGTAYMVLAYEPGVDVSNWAKQLGRPPTQDELDRIVKPLLSALEEVHRNGMMHRDISPDNLLMRQDGMAVLIDFGSAREQIRGRARAMSAIVKHGYSPPEQYTSKPELQGPWTDIYALAATLYRIMTGKLPPDAAERFIKDDLAPVSQLARAAYRPSFMQAIDRGLQMKVEDRPQTIVEWREALLRPEPLSEPIAVQRPSPGHDDHASSGRGRAENSQTPHSVEASQRQSVLPRSARLSPEALQSAQRLSDGEAVVISGRSSRPQSSSIPKSERPDLSWLEQADEEIIPEHEAAVAPTPPGKMIAYVILGLLCGAAAGGLFSILLASTISTSCFADSCIFAYLAVCASVGSIAGAIAGLHIARRPADDDVAQPPL
ncbi:MAG: serine/threonine-protein kinase [Hyphomicrobiaceae bacterium]